MLTEKKNLKESNKFTTKNYTMYNKYAQTEKASGGSSIAISNNIFHSQIDWKTNLQAVAVRLTLHKTITLCSIYIPPNFPLPPFDLTNLIKQVPAPFMIIGDFNAHNRLWGDKITDKRRKVEDVILHLNLCILNNGSNIYLHPGNGSYSSIDLTIVDPSLLINLNWSVHDDLCGSEHFPIFVNTNDRFENDSIKNRNFIKAKWIKFENL